MCDLSLSGFCVTASTTLAGCHVITVAPGSTSFHGNQPRLTVPMNVNVSFPLYLRPVSQQNKHLVPAGPLLDTWVPTHDFSLVGDFFFLPFLMTVQQFLLTVLFLIN